MEKSVKELVEENKRMQLKLYGVTIQHMIDDGDVKFFVGYMNTIQTYKYDLICDVYNTNWNEEKIEYIINEVFERFLEM